MIKNKKPINFRNNMMSILIAVITLLLSGIVATIVANHLYKINFDKQQKIETFKKVFSNRYDLQSEEFSQAINEIFVAYNDSPNVIAALTTFHHSITNNSKTSNEDLVILFKAMCEDVDIDYHNIDDSFFLTPFNTKPRSMNKSK